MIREYKTQLQLCPKHTYTYVVYFHGVEEAVTQGVLSKANEPERKTAILLAGISLDVEIRDD